MELKKSKWLLGLVVAGGLFCGTASQADFSKQQIIDFITDKVGPAIDKPGTKKMFCQRGFFTKGIMSVRSLEGNLCKQDVIGALAKVVCNGYTGTDAAGKKDAFDGSQCDDKAGNISVDQAKKTLKKQVLKNELIKGIFCSGRTFAEDGVFAEIAKACPKKK